MTDTIGFIGLGVMGGPMCRNIATKHAGRVLCFDLSDAARSALADTKVEQMDSVEALAKEADIVCLSLPGGPQVLKVAESIAGSARAGTVAEGRLLAAIAVPVLTRGAAAVVPPPSPATFQKPSGLSRAMTRISGPNFTTRARFGRCSSSLRITSGWRRWRPFTGPMSPCPLT